MDSDLDGHFYLNHFRILFYFIFNFLLFLTSLHRLLIVAHIRYLNLHYTQQKCIYLRENTDIE